MKADDGDRLTLLTLDDLKQLVTGDIRSFYDATKFDYSMEVEHERSGTFSSERASFLQRIAFKHDPTSDDVKRLFNQVNTGFAENQMLIRHQRPVVDSVLDWNRLCLWREGKQLGVRKYDIEYGNRSWLPILDPRRSFKLFYGISPAWLRDAMDEWRIAVSTAPDHHLAALYLSMALIAIHPFSDANGRVARLFFTWFLRQRGLPVVWLAEDTQGEFGRVGEGADNTQQYMNAIIGHLTDGNNLIPYHADAKIDPLKAKAAAQAVIESLRGADYDRIIDQLKPFDRHLEVNEQYLVTSPRFNCLTTVIRQS